MPSATPRLALATAFFLFSGIGLSLTAQAQDEKAAEVNPDAADLSSAIGATLPSMPVVNNAGGGFDCDTEPGLLYTDDGALENGYSGNASTVDSVFVVEPFNPGVYPATFTTVCVSFITISGPSTYEVDIVVYDDDGTDGGPGTVLGSITETVDVTALSPPLPPEGVPAVWTGIDISSLGIEVTEGNVWIGTHFATADPNVFHASDQSDDRPAGYGGGLWSTDLGATWEPVENAFAEYRSMMIRANRTSEGAALDVNPVIHDFDRLLLGESDTIEVRLANGGTETVNISDVSLDVGDHFVVNTDGTDMMLDPDEQTSVMVTFMPQAGGEFADTLMIASNDPNSPATVELSGEARDATLDESCEVDTFVIDSPDNGGEPFVFECEGGVETQGDVVGFDFVGTVEGVGGTGSWASDMCMVLEGPDGTVYGVGGISGTDPECDVNDWDFQGSGSTNDGTYESIHDDAFPGILDAGTWTLTFINDWSSTSAATMEWSDVVVTFRKVESLPAEIDVMPEELSATLEVGETEDQELEIHSLGEGNLHWSIPLGGEMHGINAPVGSAYRGGAQTTNPFAGMDLDPEVTGYFPSPEEVEAGIDNSPSASLPDVQPLSSSERLALVENGMLLVPNTTIDYIVALDPVTGDVVDPEFISIDMVSGARRHALLHPDGQRVLLSTQTGDVVHEFDVETGEHLGVFAPIDGPDNDILDNVRGMAIHPETGNILVTSSWGSSDPGAVAEFDLDGNYLGTFIDLGAGSITSPWDMLFRESDVLLTDGIGDGTYGYDHDGAFLDQFEGMTDFPMQVASAENGNVLVSTLSNGLWEFDADGNDVTTYTDVSTSYGVYELPNGNLLVGGSVSSSGNGIHEIDRDGNLIETKLDGTSYMVQFAQLLTCEIPEWLSVTPTSGTTEPGTFDVVTVTLDATDLTPGEHSAVICVDSNDEEQQQVLVPVTLTVEGEDMPIADISPESFDFEVTEGETDSDELNIANAGAVDLEWSIAEAEEESLGGQVWSEGFEEYDVGSEIAGQGGWENWDNDPAWTAFVSDDQANGGSNSLDIVADADVVRQFDDLEINSGQWVITAQQYIPDDFDGTSMFIMLNEYEPGSSDNNWSTQVEFNSSTGMAENCSFCSDAGELPLITGEWVEIRVEVDLDEDHQAFYYGGELLYEGSWSEQQGTPGTTTFDTIDLFANGATSVYYDDISVEEALVPSVCDTPSDVDWLSADPASGTTAAGETSTVDVLVDASTMEAGEELEATLCVTTNDPNALLVEIPVSLVITIGTEATPEEIEEGLGIPSPNPVNGRATFAVAVEEGQDVTVEVFDVTGRRIQTLYDGALAAGTTETLTLDASALPAGVYVIRATGEDFTKTQRVTVVR